MDLRFQLKGDLALQRRFQTSGDRVRESVALAVHEMLLQGQELARSLAPAGSTRPGQKYPPGRLRSGIIGWVAGAEEFPAFPNNGNAATNKEMRNYARMAGSGAIVGVLLSTWYTGRFFEKGVNKPKTWVGPDSKRAGFNAYAKSMRKSLYNSAKKRGYGPVTLEKQLEYETRATKSSMRASAKESKRFEGRKGFYRHQRLPARPFMAPARDMISSMFESRIQAAVTKAVAGGS